MARHQPSTRITGHGLPAKPGQRLTHSNWGPFEPSGDSEGLAINRYGDFQWNDEGSELVGGYIVEVNRVSESGTVALLGLGLLGLGLTRRKANERHTGRSREPGPRNWPRS